VVKAIFANRRMAGDAKFSWLPDSRTRSPMRQLYPLLMTPLLDPRPWGRLDLRPIYEAPCKEKIGESWLTGDNCVVQNGGLAGQSLSELASRFQRELIGEAPPTADRFPLLMKFLFPQEKLSVQVHPDDDDARAIGEPWGKTECWYVVHAQLGAELGLGLREGATRAEFERAIQANRAEELLNWIQVSAGDMIYVAGGTVHTLGPGSIIVETQQQSDTTFRLYDYGRPRELHLEHGLRVIKETVASGKVRPQPVTKFGRNGNRRQPLVASQYFVVEKFDLDAGQEFEPAGAKSSAQIMVATDGTADVTTADCDPVTLRKGDAVVVPASLGSFRVQPRERVQFLKSHVPGEQLPEPETIRI
jgi:mannose-6-phosphate isomerase